MLKYKFVNDQLSTHSLFLRQTLNSNSFIQSNIVGFGFYSFTFNLLIGQGSYRKLDINIKDFSRTFQHQK